MVPATLVRLAVAVVVVPVIRELSDAECREDILCAGTASHLHLNPNVMFVENAEAAAIGAVGLADATVSYDGWKCDVPPELDLTDQRKNKPDCQPLDFLRRGTNVRLYSLDTGINCNKMGSKYVSCSVQPLGTPENYGDPHGHGTAMALAAATFAQNASLIGIPVLGENGTGLLSDVLRGFEMVGDLHNNSMVPGVILAPLSTNPLGSSAFTDSQGMVGIALLLDQAIGDLLAQNVVTVVSAGNLGVDACTVVPAYSGNAVTVAGMKYPSRRAKLSNWGTCADIFAPFTGDVGKQTYSGTSVSAAYAAGVAASIASIQGLTARQVRGAIINNASQWRIKDARKTPERYVHAPRRKKVRSTLHIERYKAVAITIVGVAVAIGAIINIYSDMEKHEYSQLLP